MAQSAKTDGWTDKLLLNEQMWGSLTLAPNYPEMDTTYNENAIILSDPCSYTCNNHGCSV